MSEYLLFKSIRDNKELIILRDRNIKHCTGCLGCDESNACVIHDDMDDIYEKLLESDIIIVGTPNYFDNVTGLLKDFIDRTNPFYETDMLKGKKLIVIVVGGGKIVNSKKVVNQVLMYFAKCHKLDLINSYCFQALHSTDVKNDLKSLELIEKVNKGINSL